MATAVTRRVYKVEVFSDGSYCETDATVRGWEYDWNEVIVDDAVPSEDDWTITAVNMYAADGSRMDPEARWDGTRYVKDVEIGWT